MQSGQTWCRWQVAVAEQLTKLNDGLAPGRQLFDLIYCTPDSPTLATCNLREKTNDHFSANCKPCIRGGPHRRGGYRGFSSTPPPPPPLLPQRFRTAGGVADEHCITNRELWAPAPVIQGPAAEHRATNRELYGRCHPAPGGATLAVTLLAVLAATLLFAPVGQAQTVTPLVAMQWVNEFHQSIPNNNDNTRAGNVDAWVTEDGQVVRGDGSSAGTFLGLSLTLHSPDDGATYITPTALTIQIEMRATGDYLTNPPNPTVWTVAATVPPNGAVAVVSPDDLGGLDDDEVTEADGTLIATLLVPAGAGYTATRSPQPRHLWLVDNDQPAVGFADGSLAVMATEGEPMEFVVNLSGPNIFTTTVEYATVAGTATAGEDYTALTGTLSFNPGELSKTIMVSTINDMLVEDPEMFTVELSNPGAAMPGSNTRATGTILDDDTIEFTLARATGSGNDPCASTESGPTTYREGGASGVMEDFTFLNVCVIATGRIPAGSTVPVRLNITPSGDADSFLDHTEYFRGDGATLDQNGNPIAPLFYRIGRGSAAAAEVPLGNFASPQAVRVWLYADRNEEADGDLILTMTFAPEYEVPAGFRIGSQDTVAIRMLDNNLPSPDSPISSIAAATAFELERMLVFEVQLDKPAPQPGSIDYTTADLTAGVEAIAGTDYTATSGRLQFAMGEQRKRITVTLATDSEDDEGDERFMLNLTSSAFIFLPDPAEQSAIGTIRDRGPGFGLSSSGMVSEAAGQAVLTVTLNQAQSNQTTVNYATADGTAVADAHYTTTRGMLTFPAGTTVQRIMVPIVQNNRDEDDRTFTVTLTTPSAGLFILQAGATVTIADVDDPPELSVTGGRGSESSGELVFVVRLGAASNRTVTVNYETADGFGSEPAAAANTHYTAIAGTLSFTPGETEQRLTVQVEADLETVNSNAFTLRLSDLVGASFPAPPGGGPAPTTLDAPGRILELITLSISADADSVTEGSAIVFTLTAAAARTVAVTVPLSITPPDEGFAFGAAPPTAIELPANALTASWTLTIADNAQDQNEGSFTVTISDPDSPADGDDFYELGSPSSLTIPVLDDGAEVPVLTIVGPTDLQESQVTEAVFTVTLTGNTRKAVTVNYATSSAVEAAGGAPDYYQPVPRMQLRFAPGEATKNITVTVIADADQEVESFALVLSGPVGASFPIPAGGGAAPATVSATATILELIPLTLSAGGNSVAEGEAEGVVFTLTAAAARPAAVTVPVAITTPEGFSFGSEVPTELELPASARTTNWTLTIANNNQDQDSSRFTVTLSDPDSSTDRNDFYTLGSPSSLTITVTDDGEDVPTLAIAGPTDLRESQVY